MRALNLLLFLSCFCVSFGALTVEQLTVEYETNPRGVSTSKPRFSWWVIGDSSTVRGSSQGSYQILVSTSSAVTTGDLWDSGQVVSKDNTLIPYGGAALTSDTTYYWKVRVWDQNKVASAYSGVALFATGLFTKAEWHGSWVQGAQSAHNQVRYEFNISGSESINRATAFISGVGYYELYINGKKVGDHKLDVGWTNYDYTVLYSTYDVSTYLQSGANAVAIMLGRGWFGMEGYGNPQAVLQLNIYYKSGNKTEVVTDPTTWKSFTGPITYNDIYNGETYSALLETPGWDQPGFNSTGWISAGLGAWGVAATMKANFASQIMPAIKEISTLQPRLMWEPSRGVYVFDFEQNFAGWVRLSLQPLSPNVTITLRHAELLNHDGSGNIYVGNLRSAKATDYYTTKGDINGETYEPRFTYHGFRFVEVSGLPYVPTIDTVLGIHVRTSVKQTGSISFSHPLLNNIQKNTLWGQVSNLMSVPTDCDQRDERKGWTGDSALTAEEAQYNFGMGGFFTNWLNRIRDVLNRWNTGYICDVVPSEGGPSPPDPAWSSVYPTVAWTLLQFQGDKDIVQDHWAALNSFMDYWYQQVAQTGLKNMYFQFGDWVPPPPQPKVDEHYTSAFAYLHDILLMIDMANAIGATSDAAKYQSQFTNYTTEFNNAFYDSSKKTYSNAGQTAMSCALWLGVVPQNDVQSVLNYLVNDVMVTNKQHLTTGIIGTKYLLEALSKYGRTDVAVAIAQQTSYPSWGYMINPTTAETPATTLWELWDTDAEGDGMNSRNHIMFGSVSSWFHRALGGIWPGSDNRGYGHITFKPEIYTNISVTYTDDTIQTFRGPVRSSWAIPVGIPCGVAAEGVNLTLTCPDASGVINSVIFASFGTSTGQCPNFQLGSCNAANSTTIVSNACVGKNSCSIFSDDSVFGDPCYGTVKYLAAVVNCTSPNGRHILNYQVTVPFTSTADVYIPAYSGTVSSLSVQEGGVAIWSGGSYKSGVTGVQSARVDGNNVVVTVGSGSYNFDAFL